ncbi:hypothetical protein FOPG_20169 [Fusarium oxysporum f. sp. conglutinans race 2 54008]|uniref:Uncharacterized protein n=1 Tax=Fusarium oxysporum f. sp. conglutinans race 2 54008 TaxID=1089457 RepID=X0GIT8_FUSOX|nr:hypothetical protein FOPG_20169 [Fusarium oxysporum f. sp. conglutinans race 2 54008]
MISNCAWIAVLTKVMLLRYEEGGVGQDVNIIGGKPVDDGESGEFDILLMKWNKNHV